MSASAFLASAWDWKPTVIVGCGLLMGWHIWTAPLRFSRRAAAWFGGVLLILLALVSPADELADNYLFSVHMAKHIVFVLVIPALLLLGLPAGAAQRALRYPAVRRLERILSRPTVAWTAGVGMMILWHIPALFNTALSHPALHIVEHLSLLTGGTIYWWPILSPLPESRLKPVPQAAGYLFTSCLACTSMGVVITFAPALLYPAYAQPHDAYGILPLIRERWGISPALDQQIGGVLMWVPCCFVYLAATMAMFARWYGEERKTAAEA